MFRKLILAIIAVMFTFSCKPGVDSVLPTYEGSASKKTPYVQVVSYRVDIVAPHADQSTLVGNAKIRVHNPTENAKQLRAVCKFIVVDRSVKGVIEEYHTPFPVVTKWFSAPAFSSVLIESFSRSVEMYYLQPTQNLEMKCVVQEKVVR